MLRCAFCGARFRTRFELRAHILGEHARIDDTRWRCPCCGATFMMSRSITSHAARFDDECHRYLRNAIASESTRVDWKTLFMLMNREYRVANPVPTRYERSQSTQFNDSALATTTVKLHREIDKAALRIYANANRSMLLRAATCLTHWFLTRGLLHEDCVEIVAEFASAVRNIELRKRIIAEVNAMRAKRNTSSHINVDADDIMMRMMRQISLVIDADLLARLDKIARKLRMSRSALIRAIIEQYINEYEGRNDARASDG